VTGAARRLTQLSVMTLVLLAASAVAGAPASGRAIVNGDNVLVFASGSTRSAVVARLERGAEVTIEMTTIGPEGEWCQITEGSAAMPLGFVPCGTLDRMPTPRGGRGSAGAPMSRAIGPPTSVPIHVAGNLSIVSVNLERRQPAFMLIDSGASSTIITPVMLRLLGLSVAPDAPRRKLTVVGGGRIDVPFVRLSSLSMGSAVVRDVEVGVYDVAPQVPVVDGLLGGDVLQRFRATVDAGARRLHLVPLPVAGPRR
jgi:hypothetical protein